MEDEPVLKMIWSRVMHARGFVVHVADSAADAVRLAEAVRIDAVIIDLSLRGAGPGADVLVWLRGQARYPTLNLHSARSISPTQLG